MKKIIIAAMDENRVIGKNGEMPWHYPEDMKHFRKKTKGYPVIMGSTTYKSLPENYRPLEDRKNIVLTRSGLELKEEFTEVSSLEEAWSEAEKTGKDKVFIAGGGSVYSQTIDKADKMVLTIVKQSYEGDTYFPDWNRNNWIETKKDERKELEFIEYERQNS